MEKNNKFSIGLALSGGGIKGLCHAGAIKAMEEHGIIPQIISGVSAGAIVGALYADGYTADEIRSFFNNVTFYQYAKIQIPKDGFFKIDAFKQFLSKTLRAKTFEELKIPLKIVTTNITTGKLEIFSSGNLLDTILASSSMPILFKPIMINGAYHVDGGVFKNFPVSTIRDDCQTLIGINCSPLVTHEFKKSLSNIISRTYTFMSKSNTIEDRKLCDILIEPSEMDLYDTFSLSKANEIFNLGYQTSHAILSSQKSKSLL